MIELTAAGPIEQELPVLTRMVLERVEVRSKDEMAFYFLDGAMKQVKL